MRIFLCGQKYFGWLIFGVLRDLGHEIIGVAAPVEVGGKPDKLYKAAMGLDVPHVIRGGTLNADNIPAGVDLIVCAHSYDFVGVKTLKKARLGGIGYHPSLLPLHRGRDAIRWALKMGDRVTGGSVYWLTKNVDGGPIAAQDYCFIPPGITPDALWREVLQPMGVKLFIKVIKDLESGKIVAVSQDERFATWEPSMDRPPVFRPDLDQLGAINGFEVIKGRAHQGDDWGLSHSWRSLAGG